MKFAIILFLSLWTTVVAASDWYVATNGTDGAVGTIAEPLSLSKALSVTSPAQPGDTIWMRGGTYVGSWTCAINGTTGSRITVKNYANERVTLSCEIVTSPTLNVQGDFITFWGLEITNSSTDRRTAGENGVYTIGANVKFINCVVHDCKASGIWAGADAVNTEIADCLVYYNGYREIGYYRGSGHGLYLQGVNPLWKDIYGNVIFANFGIGSKFYSELPPISGCMFDRNTIFGGGQLSETDTESLVLTWDLSVGGLSTTTDVLVISNMTYNVGPPSQTISLINSESVEFWYGVNANERLRVVGNYFAGGTMGSKYWSESVITNNVFIMGGNWQFANGLGGELAELNHNDYFFPVGRATPFWFGETHYEFADWKTETGYDANSTSQNAMPTGSHVVIVPARYVTGRSTITCYNWDHADNLIVDVSSVAEDGTRYQLFNAQNLYYGAIRSGVVADGEITVPMTNLVAATPIGADLPAATGPEFQVFYLQNNTKGTFRSTTTRTPSLRGRYP